MGPVVVIEYGSPGVKMQYRIGDRIDWSRPMHKKTLPRLNGGTGIIKGSASCANNWITNWESANLEERNKDPRAVFREPNWFDVSQEVRKRFGCPKSMVIKVRIESDVIKEVFFPKDEVELIPDGW